MVAKSQCSGLIKFGKHDSRGGERYQKTSSFRRFEEGNYDDNYRTTLSLDMSVLIAFTFTMLIVSFNCHSNVHIESLSNGLLFSFSLFLIICALFLPNGPLKRPHPIIWKIVFGISFVYLIILQICLFLSFNQIKSILIYLDPIELGRDQLVLRDYAANCSEVDIERIWSHFDIYAIAHFVGWIMKTLIIRDSIICWFLSVLWEVTEIVFIPLLPNFQECWWDSIILDILICNGLGIYVGQLIIDYFGMKRYQWTNLRLANIPKYEQSVLITSDIGFSSILKRTMIIFVVIILSTIGELNTFFLKHIFAVESGHYLVKGRLVLLSATLAPTFKEFYEFTIVHRSLSLGIHFWLSVGIFVFEAFLSVKIGRDRLPIPPWKSIGIWLIGILIGSSLLLIPLCRKQKKKESFNDLPPKNNSHVTLDKITNEINEMHDVNGNSRKIMKKTN